MHRRVIRRAPTAALTVLVLAAAIAQADAVPADSDAVTTRKQTTVDLGEASPGELATWPDLRGHSCVPPADRLARIVGEPLSVGSFVGNTGRTIPVKVELFADGVERTRGDVRLAVAMCAGVSVLTTRLGWEGGRWRPHSTPGGLAGRAAMWRQLRLTA